MRVFKPLHCLLLLAATSIAGTAQAIEPKPGLWELAATVTVEGAAQSYGPYYRSQCLSKEDLHDPEKLLADNSMPECSYSNIRDKDNRFDFTVQCGGQIPMSGQGSVSYSEEKFEGSVDITADLQGLPIATRSQVSGTRAGECTP
jgi:hypothetical protein